MDNIWDRKYIEVGRTSLAVVAGMKKPNDHADKSQTLKKLTKMCMTNCLRNTLLRTMRRLSQRFYSSLKKLWSVACHHVDLRY